MTWEWVAVLAIVVFAWTVLKVTNAWMQVTMYQHVPESVKEELGKMLNQTNDV